MPLFYKEFGRAGTACIIVGSTKRGQHCQSSSVVMSYWPGSGYKINVIDYRRMRVSVIFSQALNKICTSTEAGNMGTSELTHILRYIFWKKLHPNSTWYGISTMVCTDLTEEPDACCFMRIQQITSSCTFAELPMNLTTHKETVFVACPIPLNYNV